MMSLVRGPVYLLQEKGRKELNAFFVMDRQGGGFCDATYPRPEIHHQTSAKTAMNAATQIA